MDPIALRELFNTMLLEKLSSKIFASGFFAWSGGNGFSKWLVGICFAVALLQCLTKSASSMLSEMAKVGFALWFALGIMGEPNARSQTISVPPFSNMNAAIQGNEKYRIKYGQPTIDRITFNWLKMTFDGLGNDLVASAGGAVALPTAMTKAHFLQLKVLLARTACNPDNTACMAEYLGASEDYINKKETEEANKEKSLWEQITGVTAAALTFITDIYLVVKQIANPFFWLFPILIWFLFIAQGFLSMFVLILFGISAGITMFLTKLLVPFMIIPSYRDRVKGLFRKAFSVTLYGFVMNLIIWISIFIMESLNEATSDLVVNKMARGGFIDTLARSGDLQVILMSNTLTTIVLMFMQVVAISKVPKMSEQLANLSIEEVVNIGETLLSASFGMAKMAAGMGVALAGAAIPGAAVLGKVAGAIGAGGIGGGGASPVGGGNSMVGTGMVGGRSYSGGGSGMAAAATGTPSGSGQQGGGISDSAAATTTRVGRTPTQVLKPQKRVNPDGSEEEVFIQEKLKDSDEFQGKLDYEGGPKDFEGNELLAVKQKERAVAQAKLDKEKEDYDNRIAGARTMSFLTDAVFDGMGAGIGQGDGMGAWNKAMKGGVEGAKKAIGDKNAFQAASAGMGALANRFRGKDKSEISKEDKMLNSSRLAADATGKQQQASKEKSEQLRASLTRIGQGQGSSQDMLAAYQISNEYELSKEDQEMFNDVKDSSEAFREIINEEEKINKNLEQTLFNKDNSINDDVVAQIVKRRSSGLMNSESLRNLKDAKGKEASERLYNNARETATLRAQELQYKMDSGENLSDAEKQEATNILTVGGGSLLGLNKTIDTLSEGVGNTLDVDHLRKKSSVRAKESMALKTVMTQSYIRGVANNTGKGKMGQTSAGDDIFATMKGGKLESIEAAGEVVDSFNQANINSIKNDDLRREAQRIFNAAQDYSTNPVIKKELDRTADPRYLAFLTDVYNKSK